MKKQKFTAVLDGHFPLLFTYSESFSIPVGSSLPEFLTSEKTPEELLKELEEQIELCPLEPKDCVIVLHSNAYSILSDRLEDGKYKGYSMLFDADITNGVMFITAKNNLAE